MRARQPWRRQIPPVQDAAPGRDAVINIGRLVERELDPFPSAPTEDVPEKVVLEEAVEEEEESNSECEEIVGDRHRPGGLEEDGNRRGEVGLAAVSELRLCHCVPVGNVTGTTQMWVD